MNIVKDKFSIIVPTYNEEKDIGATINNLVNLDYNNVEIIIVDDSTDDTSKIVKSLTNIYNNLIYYKNPYKKGRCEARNFGIENSNGEFLIILNADVKLEKNYLNVCKKHLNNGYDIVLSRSIVENNNKAFSKYIEYLINYDFKYNLNKIDWTEGFTCRKKLLNENNMFPQNKKFTLSSGEDAYFAQKLLKAGARKIIDLNLINIQTVPDNLREFWYIRSNRGRGSVIYKKVIEEQEDLLIGAKVIIRSAYYLFNIILILPLILKCYHYQYKVDRNFLSLKFIILIIPQLLEWISFSIGEYRGLKEIFKFNEKSK